MQFFLAESPLQSLKGDADKNGVVTSGQALIGAKDFSRRETSKLSDAQIVQRVCDRLPAHCIREDEREVALDRLEARELGRNRLTEGQAVETVEIDFSNKDALAELTLLRLGRTELTEPGNGQAVGYSPCRPSGMEPRRDYSCAGVEGVEIERASGKPFDYFFYRSLEVIKVDRVGRELRTAPHQPGGAEGESGTLVDSLRATAENSAVFEELDID